VDFLTKEEIIEFKTAFSFFENGQGSITTRDLGEVMKSLRREVTDIELKDIIYRFDPEDRGTMDFPDFLTLMSRMKREKDEKEGVVRAFQELQGDNGYISAWKLRQVLSSLGVRLTDREVDSLFQQLDIDEFGQVNYQEFLEIIARN